MKTILSLGDALRCQADLRASEAATAAILRMLSLSVPARPLDRDVDEMRQEASRVSAARQRPTTGARQEPNLGTPGESTKLVVTSDDGQSRKDGTTRTDSRNDWWPPIQVQELPKLSLASTASRQPASPLPAASTASRPPAPAPVFSTNRRRAILTAAIATRVPEGRLDMHAIITAAVRRQPLTQLPRLFRPTIRRGVQVLVDRGASLAPFRRDQDELVAHLREILGKGRLEVFEFWDLPHRANASLDSDGNVADTDAAAVGGGAAAPEDNQPPRWRAPRPGTPVLILSDFSIGARVYHDTISTSQWLRFAADLRETGSAAVGLVPYPASRWPGGLSRGITCIAWSERTTAGVVRRTIERQWARQR